MRALRPVTALALSLVLTVLATPSTASAAPVVDQEAATATSTLIIPASGYGGSCWVNWLNRNCR